MYGLVHQHESQSIEMNKLAKNLQQHTGFMSNKTQQMIANLTKIKNQWIKR